MDCDILKIKKMFGRRIRALRMNKGLTQEQLGEKASLDYKYLGGIERGERNPGFVNIVRIARGLNVTLEELFTLEHEVPDSQKLKAKIDQMLSSSDDQAVRKVYRVIKALLE